MVLLDSEQFLSELTKMFNRSKDKGTGSVYMTMKKYDGRTKPRPRKMKKKKGPAAAQAAQGAVGGAPAPAAASSSAESFTGEYKCLLRASLATKKISTVISSREINKFVPAYSSVLKGNMEGLKKREKPKEKKKKARSQRSRT